jgi:hypothetical protein
MRNFKRIAAFAMASVMVFGSTMTAFADGPSVTGSGSSTGHMDRSAAVNVVFPTELASSNPFNFIMDSERLIREANLAYKDSTVTLTPEEENDTGVYFQTFAYEAVTGLTDAVEGTDVTAFYEKSGNTYSKTQDTNAQSGTTYYEITGAASFAVGESLEQSGDDYVVTTDAAEDPGKTYYTATEKTGLTVAVAGSDVSSYYERGGESGSYVYTKTTDTNAQSGKTYYEVNTDTKAYDNTSTALTVTNKSAVSIDISATAKAVGGTMALAESSEVSNENLELYLGITVGEDTKTISTEDVKATAKVEGVEANFQAVPHYTESNGTKTYDGTYDFVVKDNATGWKTTNISMTGAVSEAQNTSNLTAPTVNVTWGYEVHESVAPSLTDTTATYTKGSDTDVELAMANTTAINSVKLGDATLTPTDDYTFAENKLTIKAATLDARDADDYTLTVDAKSAEVDSKELTATITVEEATVADAAPSIETTSYAYTSGSALEIPVSLGSGSLAATGINRITYTNSSGVATTLATTNWSYADGKITFVESYITSLANNNVTRNYKVTFDGESGTATQITINLHP